MSDSQRERRVLLVEDEPGLQEALALVLEAEGFRVVRAHNGREALDLLTRERPDLILTDYMMPYMDGLELIEHIRRDPVHATVPILLMSAALPPGTGSRADAFLPKPAGIVELMRAVDRLLESV